MSACWSCKAPVDVAGALTCPACGVVVPPGQATPFARLGVAMAWEHDEKELERAWLQRSRAVHPDRFARKSDAERRYAAEQTASLNDAWRMVQDPFDRAAWLVKNAGVDVSKLDQALLVDMMEARERAEESPTAKAAVVEESTARFAALMATLPPLLADLADRRSLERAGRSLAELKTLARLVDDLGGPRLIRTLSER